MLQTPRDIADAHQQRRDALAEATAARATRLFRRIDPQDLDVGWHLTAPAITATVSAGQITAARQAAPYANAVAVAQDFATEPARLVPQAFQGVTKEGRGLAPELFTAITATKKLIGRGASIPAAFRSGAALMHLLAANAVRDMGRSADSTIAAGKGFTYSVRVISPGACSRCAILAGVTGYKTGFDRHPGCRCTSMPVADADSPPDGFYRSADDYFDSLDGAERERIFTKAGAKAIEAGADPVKIVNARRAAKGIGYTKRGTGRTRSGRLQPVIVGRNADGSPIQVYATTEGVTSRSAWSRSMNDDVRRTKQLRLMPESIMKMSRSPEEARELLKQYGYLA